MSSLQHTATHCNALQHTATHCNLQQHTATHLLHMDKIAMSISGSLHCMSILHSGDVTKGEMIMFSTDPVWVGVGVGVRVGVRLEERG